MLLPHNAILGLPVETKSGAPLGKIIGFLLDPDTHVVVQYEVGRGVFHTRKTALLVHREQVIDITPKKMIVEDGERAAGAPVLSPQGA